MRSKAVKSAHIILAFLLIALLPYSAAADTCTERSLYTALQTESGSFLTNIVEQMRSVLQPMTFVLFNGLVSAPEYQSALGAALTLFIAFFGVSFMLGFVAPTFAQLLIRVLKIGAIAGMMTPAGWHMFNTTLVRIFGATGCAPGMLCESSGVDWLMDIMILLGGGDPRPGPFFFIEPLVEKVFSPKLFVLVIGNMTSSALGLFIAIMLALAIFNFFRWMLLCLEIYLVSMMLRTVLLGLGPVFIVMALFERTKPVFVGWVRLLVASSLPPILLFIFMPFIFTTMDSAVEKLIWPMEGHRVVLCYTRTEHVDTWVFEKEHWRYAIDREIFENPWEAKDENSERQAFPYPSKLLPVMVFLLLTGICITMNRALISVGANIGGGSFRLGDAFEEFSGWWHDNYNSLFNVREGAAFEAFKAGSPYYRWHQFRGLQLREKGSGKGKAHSYAGSVGMLLQRKDLISFKYMDFQNIDVQNKPKVEDKPRKAPRASRERKKREEVLKKPEVLQIRYDVGLIGFSGAGKSMFIDALEEDVSNALALRVVTVKRQGTDFVIADCPGPKTDGFGTREEEVLLVETVRQSHLLLHLVDGTQEDVVSRRQQLRDLLRDKDITLLQKPEIMVLTKCDLLDEVTVSARAMALREACMGEVFTLSLTGQRERNEALEALLERLKEKSLEFRV